MLRRWFQVEAYREVVVPSSLAVGTFRSQCTPPAYRHRQDSRTLSAYFEPPPLSPNTGSILTKTFGVHVACGIAKSIFLYCDQLNDSSKEMMMKLLESTEDIVDNWDPDGQLSPYIGGGRRNVGLVTEMLRAEIRKQFENILDHQSVKPA